jgi:hypothetical protein
MKKIKGAQKPKDDFSEFKEHLADVIEELMKEKKNLRLLPWKQK